MITCHECQGSRISLEDKSMTWTCIDCRTHGDYVRVEASDEEIGRLRLLAQNREETDA